MLDRTLIEAKTTSLSQVDIDYTNIIEYFTESPLVNGAMDVAITSDGLKALVISTTTIYTMDLSTLDMTHLAAAGARCVAIDPTNTYALVTDSGSHVIRKIIIDTGVVSIIAGSAGYQGNNDGDGTSATFKGPTGLAIHPDGTYALVGDSGNHVIRKIDLSTFVVSTFAGSGTRGYPHQIDGNHQTATFSWPQDIAIDPTGTFALVLDREGQGLIR